MIAADKIEQLISRFQFIEAKMADGASGSEIAELGREYAELRPVVETVTAYKNLVQQIADAEAMLKELRPSDTLARIGGDEFVLLVDDVLDVSETRITERLQTAIKRVAEAFELQTYGVGSAIGVLIIDANLPESPERLLALADREMYAAKSSQTDTIRVQSLSALSSSLFDSDYS